MPYKYKRVDFDSLASSWDQLQEASSSAPIFSSRSWTSIWWRHFGHSYSNYLGEISSDGKTLGIVPLALNNDTAQFIGSENVCDYLDFVISKGYEDIFFRTLINHLVSEGIGRLDLLPVREGSTVMTSLLALCQQSGLSISVNAFDVSPYLDLPSKWETYLSSLEKKQRHELRRKLRRLDEHGNLRFNRFTTISEDQMSTFLKLFRDSRGDKELFMTSEMESFFRDICSSLAGLGYLRLNVLEINASQIAHTISFDYHNQRLLYNSGFDRTYGWLSAGLISKALCVKESIEEGKERFDFLRGNEEYKYHLGAVGCPVYRCTVLLTNKI